MPRAQRHEREHCDRLRMQLQPPVPVRKIDSLNEFRIGFEHTVIARPADRDRRKPEHSIFDTDQFSHQPYKRGRPTVRSARLEHRDIRPGAMLVDRMERITLHIARHNSGKRYPGFDAGRQALNAVDQVPLTVENHRLTIHNPCLGLHRTRIVANRPSIGSATCLCGRKVVFGLLRRNGLKRKGETTGFWARARRSQLVFFGFRGR